MTLKWKILNLDLVLTRDAPVADVAREPGDKMCWLQDHWQVFQLYMLTIVLIVPTIIMTIAYSAISRKLLNLSSSKETLNRTYSSDEHHELQKIPPRQNTENGADSVQVIAVVQIYQENFQFFSFVLSESF